MERVVQFDCYFGILEHFKKLKRVENRNESSAGF